MQCQNETKIVLVLSDYTALLRGEAKCRSHAGGRVAGQDHQGSVADPHLPTIVYFVSDVHQGKISTSSTLFKRGAQNHPCSAL